MFLYNLHLCVIDTPKKRREEDNMKGKIGVARRGRDVAAMVSLLLEQSSHLVVARRTVAASVHEQWGMRERWSERDRVRA